VIVHGENEAKKSAATLTGSQKDILVMFSSGMVLQDLHSMHGWKATLPRLSVLLLGASQKDSEFLQYVRSGIRGFLPADAAAKEIVHAAHAVNNGEAVCGGGQCAILCGYLEKEAEMLPSAALHRELGLTRREQQLIPLLTRGLTNKEIANHFSLSEQTVKNHLYRMKRKIGASGRLEIVDVCRQHGFLA
jgi:DNA-binding NarL/FixJ family response regulator